MFSRSDKNTPKIETIVGASTEIEGNLKISESLRIDGKIKGEITAQGVIVGELGAVLGDINANTVTVGGKVKGNISASMSLEILPNGHVLGDIRTNKLIIADGATFEGNCQMLKQDGQIVELTPALYSSEIETDSKAKHLKVIGGGGNGKH